MSALADWGYDVRFQFHFDEAAAGHPDAIPGRVIRIDRGVARVANGEHEHALPITGKMALDPPTVGDVVGFEPREGGLLFVVERRQQLSRRRAGSATEQQRSLPTSTRCCSAPPADRLNPAWVERGLTLAWDSGASPVVLVTKADLLDDVEQTQADLEQRAVGADVVPVTVQDPASVDRVGALLVGQTGVCLGPSGAGKSSLLNALLGEQLVAEGVVRDGDHKGRHTTVRRELHPLPGGGMLIDTPGTESSAWSPPTTGGRAASTTSTRSLRVAGSTTARTRASPAARCCPRWPQVVSTTSAG